MTSEQPQFCPVVSPDFLTEEHNCRLSSANKIKEMAMSFMEKINKSGGAPRTLKFALAAGAAVIALGAAQSALAYEAYVNGPAPILTGPSTDYPPVVYLHGGEPVEVYGCLDGYQWCDISFRDFRGWFDSSDLFYGYQGQQVPLYDYGYDIGLPIIGFSFDDYWGRYYRDRPFYRERERFEGIRIAPPRDDHDRFEDRRRFEQQHGLEGRPGFGGDHRPDSGRPDFGRPDQHFEPGQGRPDFNRGPQFDQQRQDQRGPQDQQRVQQDQQRAMQQQRGAQEQQRIQQMQQRGAQEQQQRAQPPQQRGPQPQQPQPQRPQPPQQPQRPQPAPGPAPQQQHVQGTGEHQRDVGPGEQPRQDNK
jgi:uncharacterized protein YraI